MGRREKSPPEIYNLLENGGLDELEGITCHEKNQNSSGDGYQLGYEREPLGVGEKI